MEWRCEKCGARRNDDELLTTAEAAALLGISPAGLRKAAIEERIPAHKPLGRGVRARWRFRRGDLLGYGRDRGRE